MKRLDAFSNHAHWLLRIALVSVFLYHALGQMFAIDAFVDAMGSAALKEGILPLTILSIVLEMVGSALLLFGAFSYDWMTRLGASLFVPVMLGAILIFHIQDGWAKMELEFVLLMVSLYFLFVGNAPIGTTETRSVDRLDEKVSEAPLASA